MTTISRDVTKSWSGDQRASTQLISVPKMFWAGTAELIRIEPGTGTRAWARVLDGHSDAFWGPHPPVFGDHQTMAAFTDLLVVQFFAEGQEQGTARGVFQTVKFAAPKKPGRFEIPPLKHLPKTLPVPKPGPVELVSVEPTPAYVVLEGAQRLDDQEVADLLQRIDELQVRR